MTAEEFNNVNDFQAGSIHDVVVTLGSQIANTDKRGWLAELARCDQDGDTPMVYVSSTIPGVTRGPHEHKDQTDRFLFVGLVWVILWDNRSDSPTFNVKQTIHIAYVGRVSVPPGVVHAYFNVGPSPVLVVNAPDKLYRGQNRQDPVDEIRHEDDPDTRFKL